MPKKHIVYHNDGSIWAKGLMVKGVCDGRWEWFRKDGSKMRSGHFKNGKQTGKWVTYDKRGRPLKETTFCSRGHVFKKSAKRPVCAKCWPGYYKK